MESYLAVNQISLDSVHHCTPPLNWNCQRLPRRLFDDGVRLKTTVPYSRHSHSRIVHFPSLTLHLVLCIRVESWDWSVLVKLEALQCLQLPTYPRQHPPASIHYRRIQWWWGSYVCFRTFSLYVSSRRELRKTSSFPLSYSTNEWVSILENQHSSDKVSVVTTSTS